jgi:hypothetical protein
VHSRYQRRLADAALGGRQVLIVLSMRRLFCDHDRCARRTFAEQVEGLTVRYARRTPLLRSMRPHEGHRLYDLRTVLGSSFIRTVQRIKASWTTDPQTIFLPRYIRR